MDDFPTLELEIAETGKFEFLSGERSRLSERRKRTEQQKENVGFHFRARS
jgi:hypothetical protein